MGLEEYQRKRDFRRTPEPKGRVAKVSRHRFVVQEHHASKLHFDFRLEMGGVLKSWSMPRGPSLDPQQKRLAVTTEDHPVEYLKFVGHIPEGNYGAGEHMIWDAGIYEPLTERGPLEQYERGKINFRLQGEKLRGEFTLLRLNRRPNQWLLIKSDDKYADPAWKLELVLATDEQGRAFERGENATAKQAARHKVKKKSVERIKTKPNAGEAVSAAALFRRRELSGDAEVKLNGEIVSLTNLDKLYWPDDGYTKGDLIKYYYQVSRYILPYLKDRPLILKRYPDGIAGKFFHQHDVDRAPEYVRTERIAVEGHEVDYIIGDNTQTLLYMANLGAIERHPWNSRVADLDHPDWVVFDLDPGAVEFAVICELAMKVKKVLDELDLDCFPKTSGSRGLHIYVPIKPVHDYKDVALFAERVATRVAQENKQIATVERSLAKRKRAQIYVDHMQNARGKSVAGPYSVRPRAGATVSAPLTWAEVKAQKVTPADFTIKNMLARLEKKGDHFKSVLRSKQMLTDAIEQLS